MRPPAATEYRSTDQGTGERDLKSPKHSGSTGRPGPRRRAWFGGAFLAAALALLANNLFQAPGATEAHAKPEHKTHGATTHVAALEMVLDSPLSHPSAQEKPWFDGTVLGELENITDAGTGRWLKAPKALVSSHGGSSHGGLTLLEKKALAASISRMYQLAPEAAMWIVGETELAALEAGVDPVTLLAIVGVESRFNPYAGSSAGAVGLTQTMPRAHPDAVAQVKAKGRHVFEPESNLRMGAGILRMYLKNQGGNLQRALQQYNGALSDDTYRYARKVLDVRTRLTKDMAKAQHQGVLSL